MQNGMSALPPKADMCGALADVRFVPIADIRGPRGSPSRTSEKNTSAGQNNPDFGELVELCIDFD